MITTRRKSFDINTMIATTSSFIALSNTRNGLKMIPISSSIACGLTITNRVLYEIIMQK